MQRQLGRDCSPRAPHDPGRPRGSREAWTHPTNAAEIAKAPRLEEEDIEPYSIEEVQSLLLQASKLRNSARWVVALALGLRQGEALGLHWEDVDLDAGYARIRKNRLRPRYRRGCGDGEPCGRKAGYCPQREQTRREHKSTKSRAGRRTVGLPDPLIKLLRHHRDEQDRERSAAGSDWEETTKGPTADGGALRHRAR